jgi:hypothetical protein
MIKINIIVSTTVATHLLGGLAKQYKDLPSYINNYNAIKTELETTMFWILQDLHRQGIDVFANPFKTYSQLINYKPVQPTQK